MGDEKLKNHKLCSNLSNRDLEQAEVLRLQYRYISLFF